MSMNAPSVSLPTQSRDNPRGLLAGPPRIADRLHQTAAAIAHTDARTTAGLVTFNQFTHTAITAYHVTR
jgi:hypothetical protein